MEITEAKFEVRKFLIAQASYIKGNHDGIRGCIEYLKEAGQIEGVTWDEVEKVLHANFNDYIAKEMPLANKMYQEGQQYVEHVKESMEGKPADA